MRFQSRYNDQTNVFSNVFLMYSDDDAFETSYYVIRIILEVKKCYKIVYATKQYF